MKWGGGKKWGKKRSEEMEEVGEEAKWGDGRSGEVKWEEGRSEVRSGEVKWEGGRGGKISGAGEEVKWEGERGPPPHFTFFPLKLQAEPVEIFCRTRTYACM